MTTIEKVFGLFVILCLIIVVLGTAIEDTKRSIEEQIETLCNTENVFVLNDAAYVCVPCEGCKDNKDKKEK